MSVPGEFGERLLTPKDASEAQQLVIEAGWNQVLDDWRLLFALGQGFGLEQADGRLIATALTVPLSARIGWISMVLVAGHARRGGLGSRLLRRCLEHHAAAGRIAGLDATELGRPVYLKLGFRENYRLSRLVLDLRMLTPPSVPKGVVLTPLTDGDSMAEVIAWDCEISGLERGEILRALQSRMPQCGWSARREGRLIGYILARNGRNATHLGPAVAEDFETAALLTATAAQSAGTAAFMDVPVAQVAFTQWLQSRGATVQRGFTRMLLETETPFDRPERIFAIAGPELG